MMGFELLLVSTLSWWACMGAMFRMVDGVSTSIVPSMGSLGFGQLSPRTRRLGWNPPLPGALTVLPLFPGPFHDNVGIFPAIIGGTLAPMIAIQITDFFLLRRIDSLQPPSLCRYDARSRYWYAKGCSPAGITALLAGSLTCIAVLDPLTFLPNAALFQYTGATIPAALVGAVACLIGTRLSVGRWQGAEGPGDTDEGRWPRPTTRD